jgi:small subunit ribosomal protein S11
MAKKKAIKRNVIRGVAHVKATFNNTRVTITDSNGDVLCTESAGSTGGFTGGRKSAPYAATRAGESVGYKARKMGLVELEVQIKGPGPGREAAVTGIVSSGLKVLSIEDVTPIPHNGCRPRKKRRV